MNIVLLLCRLLLLAVVLLLVEVVVGIDCCPQLTLLQCVKTGWPAKRRRGHAQLLFWKQAKDGEYRGLLSCL